MGGLATAIDLARQGVDVTILDRAAEPGGKMRELLVDGRPVAAGPTVLTMRWVFEELFADAGATLSDHLALTQATTLARHAWGEQRLDLFADRDRSADAIAAFAGPDAAKGYRAFCKEARKIYEALEVPHIRAPRPSMLGLIGKIGPFRALSLKPYDTLWDELKRHFKDQRLRQLFARYATYCGTSPFTAPATLMLVAHVEQEGVWTVGGGIQRLAEAMAALARHHGVTFQFDAPVSEITVASGQATGIRLASGEAIKADAVVMNGEPGAIGAGLFGRAATSATPPPPKFPQRSLSATTWAMVATTAGPPLHHHNILFSKNYEQEFKLIQNGMLPTEPTTYICAQDRTDGAPDPQGPERLLMLVNAPASGDRRAFSQVEIDQCMQGVSGLLQRSGIQINGTAAPVLTTPSMFHRLFPASGGALYGPAVQIGSGGLKRADSRTSLPRLYLAGGSAHPGAGVPMATLSGRQAAAAVMADLASIKPSRKTATPGGTSTP